MNVITTKSFSDELTKIAASRWRRAMRAGELLADDVGRLRAANILNYGREIAGLQRGTANIAAKKGFGVAEFSGREALEGLKDLVGGRGPAKLKQQLGTALAAAGGGGYAALPAYRTAAVVPGLSPLLRGTSGETRSAIDAIAKRHEIDELSFSVDAVRKALEGGDLPRRYIPSIEPYTLKERLRVGSGRARDRLIDAAAAKFPGLEQVKQLIPRAPGRVPTGVHFSPEVITRESSNIAMMPPEAIKRMSNMRMGEIETLTPHGLTYSEAPSPSTVRKIRKLFARGEI